MAYNNGSGALPCAQRVKKRTLSEREKARHRKWWNDNKIQVNARRRAKYHAEKAADKKGGEADER